MNFEILKSQKGDECSSAVTKFTEETGQITSPGYPNQYRDNQLCQYTITVGIRSKIVVDFKYFLTEGKHDRVVIYDGNTTSAPVLGDFSGSSIPPQITSTKNKIFIKFSTDGSTTYRGFKLNYRSVYAKRKINLVTFM